MLNMFITTIMFAFKWNRSIHDFIWLIHKLDDKCPKKKQLWLSPIYQSANGKKSAIVAYTNEIHYNESQFNSSKNIYVTIE